MKRYTKSVNVRFEPIVEQHIDKILQVDTRCKQQNWSRSDVVRHFVRTGIKTWENNMRGKY